MNNPTARSGVHERQRSFHRSLTDPWLFGGVVGLAGALSLHQSIVGPTADYARIFPPPWLVLIGVLAVAVAALPAVRTRVRSGLEWTAGILFIGASGGFVLDAFRGFFAVTGIPAGDFANVDLPGAIMRGLSLLAAFLVLLRRQHGDEEHRGLARHRRFLLCSGLVLTIPYPLLKLVWWVQGNAAEHSVGFPVMEIASFALAACGVIALTTTWGRFVPRVLVLTGGWVAAAILLNMGFLMVFGVLAQASHLARGTVQFAGGEAPLLVTGVYGSWLALGLVMMSATLLFISSPRGPGGRRPRQCASRQH